MVPSGISVPGAGNGGTYRVVVAGCSVVVVDAAGVKRQQSVVMQASMLELTDIDVRRFLARACTVDDNGGITGLAVARDGAFLEGGGVGGGDGGGDVGGVLGGDGVGDGGGLGEAALWPSSGSLVRLSVDM